MDAVDVDEAAERLYALPPEEFTVQRDDLARQADGPVAKAIKALRKPTVPAHVVNRLVRARPGDVDGLLALGDELRAAMSGGGDVRSLTEQRRQAISDLVGSARAAADRELTAAIEQDVAATLEAATADPDLGAAVRSGRLVKPLRYAGFGTLPDLGDALATPISSRGGTTKKAAARPATKKEPRPVTPKKSPDRPAKPAPSEPSAELTRLRSRVLDLAGKADDAQRRYDEASRAVRQARELLEAAERERADAHKAASAAHKDAEKARRELGRLERS